MAFLSVKCSASAHPGQASGRGLPAKTVDPIRGSFSFCDPDMILSDRLAQAYVHDVQASSVTSSARLKESTVPECHCGSVEENLVLPIVKELAVGVSELVQVAACMGLRT